jgi:hypothetical protein
MTSTAEMSSGCVTATTAAGMASTPTTMSATTATAVTTAAAMLGHGGGRNGHCRYQHARRQEEAPTLDAHDYLRNLSRRTMPSAHCEPINNET